MISPQRDYWPTTDWREVTPREVGIDASRLADMQAHIQQHVPGLHGLLIVRQGYLAFEEYYQGFHRSSYNSISSATKTIFPTTPLEQARGRAQVPALAASRREAVYLCDVVRGGRVG